MPARMNASPNLRFIAGLAIAGGLLLALASCGGGGGYDGGGSSSSPVKITAPAALATGLTGTVSVSADASGYGSTDTVEFEIDGLPLGTATSAPYRVDLDTTRHASGQHVLRARARTAAGQTSAWSAITVQFGGGRDLPVGFSRSDLTTALSRATAMAQAPDGRFFVAQQTGSLRVVKNGALLANDFVTLAVDSAGERGLIGVTVHPDFANNGFVYVYYTTAAGGTHNRVSRFTASGDVAAPGSELVLVDLPALSGATNHNGGALHFGSDGKLYVAVGDNANSAHSQNQNDPLGKLLRFNDDGGIPTDNPFCGTAGVQACAVWALGLRNPFTFAVQPGTGRIHINDVGQGTWEEIDLGRAGANYGWPSSEGPDNTRGFDAPLFAYKHSAASPAGSGPGGFFTGFAITGGTFYPDAGPFPAGYRGAYYFADFATGFIARLDTANGNAAYAFANGFSSVVDLAVGIDGALYVLRQGALTRIAVP